MVVFIFEVLGVTVKLVFGLLLGGGKVLVHISQSVRSLLFSNVQVVHTRTVCISSFLLYELSVLRVLSNWSYDGGWKLDGDRGCKECELLFGVAGWVGKGCEKER